MDRTGATNCRVVPLLLCKVLWIWARYCELNVTNVWFEPRKGGMPENIILFDFMSLEHKIVCVPKKCFLKGVLMPKILISCLSV